MKDSQILSSDKFIKVSKALATSLIFQISILSELYKTKNKNPYDELKDDWVIGYIFGWIHYLYQQSVFKDFENGFFYILYGIYSKWKISGLDDYSEHSDFFKKIENKIDEKNNSLYEGMCVGYKDSKHNFVNRKKKKGIKISLQRFLLKKFKKY